LLSLVASFTIVPLLTSRFGKLERVSDKNIFGRFILWFEDQLRRFTRWITGVLKWSLRHKFMTLGLITVLLFSSFALVIGGFIGGEFFAAGDSGEFLVQVEMPKDASIEQTNQMTQKAEKFLSTKPEIISLITTVGQSSDGGFGGAQATAYKSEISVKLVGSEDREDPLDVYSAKLKRELEKVLVGAKVKTVPIGLIGSPEQAPFEMVVIGPDLDSVLTYAEAVLGKVQKIPGTSEAKLSVESGTPEIEVAVDRDKMAALGLNLQTVGASMQTAFNGNTDGKFRSGEYEYDINIRFDDYNRKNVDDVSNLQFTNDRGELIKLSQFATIREGSGPSQLERRDKSTSVKVQSQVVGRTVGEIAAELESQLTDIRVPSGVSYVWSGAMEQQSEGFGTLGIALLAAVLLVYFIMVALYDSFVYPLVVMFSIPLAIIGALLALALTNNTLNIFTILGLIMLIGLVAKNAIMLVDFTNHEKARGKSTHDALIAANHARLRPILMTTIAMVFGMLPIAIATGPSAEWKNGLAWVIIGGLLSSLFLTLIVVPVIYQIVDNILHYFGLDKKGKPIEELMVEEYVHKEVKEYEEEAI
jgi:hydrophobic/amphiphilic exporter-1 (mainly G- bacteria), HAE1 family